MAVASGRWFAKNGAEIAISTTAVPWRNYVIPDLTVGVEMELLLWPTSGALWDPTPLFTRFEGDKSVSQEARQDMVEVKTVHPDPSPQAVLAELKGNIGNVVRYLNSQGVLALPLSLDPLKLVAPVAPYPFIQRITDLKHGRGPTHLQGNCSFQVNVAVGDGNAALHVHKALRGIGPLLIAMTASSPFFNRAKSGLVAMRPNIRSLCLDSGWVPEEIAETQWEEYFARRAKLCEIGPVMTTPWAHNGPMRIRPDRDFCIEFAQSEVVWDLRRAEAVVRFLRDLTRKVLESYCDGNPIVMQPFLGNKLSLGIQKNTQEAAIRGLEGKFITTTGDVVPTKRAIEGLLEWVGADDYASLLDGPSTGEALLAEFNRRHPVCAGGCSRCAETVEALCVELAVRFADQFGILPCLNLPVIPGPGGNVHAI